METNRKSESLDDVRTRLAKSQAENRSLRDENRKLQEDLAALKSESDEVIRGLKSKRLESRDPRPNIYRHRPQGNTDRIE